MAVLGFNFSPEYREALLSGTKKATVVMGERALGVGDDVIVTLPKSGESMFAESAVLQKIGVCKITAQSVCRVSELSEAHARQCGYDSRPPLIEGLRKWYGATDDSVVTYVEFNLALDKAFRSEGAR